MSALEDSLRKVYKLPQVGTSARGIDAASSFLQKAQEQPELQNTPEFQVATAMIQQNQPRLMDGSPLPEGMVPGLTQTMEYRDANQNGIEDRSEGIYLPQDLVPESSLPPRMIYPGFNVMPPEGSFGDRMRSRMPQLPNMPSDLDPLDEMDEETKQRLQDLLGKSEQKAQAPLAPIAQQLAMAGQGEDTTLAHLRPGEIVIPPEFMEDSDFESALEKKFIEYDIDPVKSVVGVGIASLNPQTGLEQFGFFKKVFKGIKKVVKKVAPIAAFIPGVGTALGGVLGGIGGLATKIPGIGGALGSIGSSVAGGIAKLGIPGISSIAGGTAGGFGGIGKALTTKAGLFGGAGGAGGIGKFFSPAEGSTGIFGGQIGPNIRRGIGGLFRTPDFNPTSGQISGGGIFGRVKEFILPGQDQRGLFQNLGLFGGGQQQVLYDAQGNPIQVGGGGNFLGNLLGGGGGGGMSPLGMLGIGGLAAGLGKLAYEDAKKQKGVALTPMVTMSPTGRYNIEAEIARRMGQARPNPVEFGLLPEGTIPELSGGKPGGMMYGGAVEDLTGGMARGLREGGAAEKLRGFKMRAERANDVINELENTFNPNNIRDLAASNLPFDPTKIENMLMSAEKKAYDQAKYEFMMPILRMESGAQISESEIDWMNRTYFPQLGDDEETIMQKRLARQRAVESLMPEQKPQSKGIASMPAMMYGGPVMAYAQGGAVQMQEGGGLDPSQFPRMDGDINGPGTETSDDIPAMLSDGEFVMTGQAVRGAGSYDMQKDAKGIISLTPSFNEDRERGMDLMYKMMDTFAGEAKPS